MSHFRIMVSGGLNFHSSYTNSTSYKSRLIQLNFETLLRSLRLIKTDWKRMLLLNDCYIAVYGHFFALCMLFFHKPEVQTVILICSMGLNLNWHKSYCLKCSLLRLTATLATSQKIATDKWPVYDNFWPFFHQLYAHLSQN